ncbi:Poly [ADP-ribose] polymerase 1 [Senna tora]|uniref:Poly [ADP-ribose] polymerase n=1 Tax=Senna tora TaxID=362788 RepID=A0A834WGF1_9FABA|nr:Poly [ADP-ribose] polymerase 1 [Senna tora]
MANPQKPWKAEYAKSGRSSCKTCKSSIDKETFRLGKMVQATQFDGFMPMWHHAACILKKAKQIKSTDDVEGLESLRWEDQQKVRKYVESAEQIKSNSTKDIEYGIEVSQTARATFCKLIDLGGILVCKRDDKQRHMLIVQIDYSNLTLFLFITKVRISSKPDGQGAKGLAWHHAKCLMELFPSLQVEKLPGWNSLSPSDQSSVSATAKKRGVAGNEAQEVKEATCESTSKAGMKRRKDASGDLKSKVAKTEGDVSEGRASSVKNGNDSRKASDMEKRLEIQTKELWDLKDDLKKHVTTAELRVMLETNGQDSTGSELDLRDRCADGMMFGPLGSCPICSGCLRYSGGMYRCHGYVSAWSKCSYSISEPIRLRQKWKVPEGTNNQYLKKWFKSQKAERPVRIVPPQSSTSGSQIVACQHQLAYSESLGELRVAIAGPKESIAEWKCKVEGVGGVLHAKVKKDTNCLVVIGALDGQEAEMRKAKRMKVPIVREDYLVDCMERKKKLPLDLYKVEATSETSSMVTVKVKGRSAVHEASGLQDSGHILEEGKSIFNTTLNMSDLSSGVNRYYSNKSRVYNSTGLSGSYYILQIIQEDKGSNCHVFRKWGRVGNDKIGGNKLENLSKADAIAEFKRLFFEKTGNPWEAWEQKDFQKQPGRFFPLDIDYGVNKQVSKKNQNDADSKLAPPLIELMKMLFNVETYRAAMMEFEINMSEMPLGKLSKSNIQKGFEALTEIQNLLNSHNPDPSVRESLLIDASNRFFTVIPSIHPHIIRDEEDFKSKVKMLESLQDIEIASRLVGFDVDSDDSIDDKYKKLHCDISPLPHDSEDYRLIEKFLHTTHAPTHTDWSLELEEVFSLEREGEFDKYAPHREKLGNRMLLWHGSRLTNFVGILNQGLRIAPPEAPATGYMFGKGIYFADLVSKSAQYCYTDKKNPVGLMLLSEVALGNIYELKNAKYMDKPPNGKHSTKGLGKKIPNDSEFVKWRDDVTVPCGKPVQSKVKTSELMYNEYIVYNTAQVKMQFLLKVVPSLPPLETHNTAGLMCHYIGNGGSPSPCGACKFLRRKCGVECIFAPYFCSEQGPARFAAIHKVFGASNVSKLLLHIPAQDRSEAVLTIAYEAQARIRDPVYGCRMLASTTYATEGSARAQEL